MLQVRALGVGCTGLVLCGAFVWQAQASEPLPVYRPLHVAIGALEVGAKDQAVQAVGTVDSLTALKLRKVRGMPEWGCARVGRVSAHRQWYNDVDMAESSATKQVRAWMGLLVLGGATVAMGAPGGGDGSGAPDGPSGSKSDVPQYVLAEVKADGGFKVVASTRQVAQFCRTHGFSVDAVIAQRVGSDQATSSGDSSPEVLSDEDGNHKQRYSVSGGIASDTSDFNGHNNPTGSMPPIVQETSGHLEAQSVLPEAVRQKVAPSADLLGSSSLQAPVVQSFAHTSAEVSDTRGVREGLGMRNVKNVDIKGEYHVVPDSPEQFDEIKKYASKFLPEGTDFHQVITYLKDHGAVSLRASEGMITIVPQTLIEDGTLSKESLFEKLCVPSNTVGMIHIYNPTDRDALGKYIDAVACAARLSQEECRQVSVKLGLDKFDAATRTSASDTLLPKLVALEQEMHCEGDGAAEWRTNFQSPRMAGESSSLLPTLRSDPLSRA